MQWRYLALVLTLFDLSEPFSRSACPGIWNNLDAFKLQTAGLTLLLSHLEFYPLLSNNLVGHMSGPESFQFYRMATIFIPYV